MQLVGSFVFKRSAERVLGGAFATAPSMACNSPRQATFWLAYAMNFHAVYACAHEMPNR